MRRGVHACGVCVCVWCAHARVVCVCACMRLSDNMDRISKLKIFYQLLFGVFVAIYNRDLYIITLLEQA